MLVPLSAEETMADFALRLEARLVIATRPGLGTLNHTALTLEAARSRSLAIHGLVISNWPAEPGLAERTNLDVLNLCYTQVSEAAVKKLKRALPQCQISWVERASDRGCNMDYQLGDDGP